MKGTSKLVMGATVVSLGIVLGLVLVLVAELYCSLLLRKRRLRSTTTPQSPQQDPSVPVPVPVPVPPPTSFYSQGVLHAPRSLLFPNTIPKQQQQQEKQEMQNPYSKPHQESNITPSSSQSFQETALQGSCSGHGEHFVYISNPIYDNTSRVGTPYETPDTSPSRLEMGGSGRSSDDEENGEEPSSLPITPPLTPMKKLPSEACSVSLRDVRSLGTSGSDSNSHNILSSSSSSGSPCTSPSW